jgi:predicted amidohydrolase YtcJ
MRKMERIPLLKDSHTHPYLYAALGNCLDISSITGKKEAVSRITERFATEEFVIVTGWYNSSFGFEDDELDVLPPLVIFNISLHSMLMNAAARKRLAGSFPQVVENYLNGGWVERNAPLVLDFMVKTKPCGVGGLRSYFAGLARLGVWYAEEMSLQGDAEVELFREASLIDRTSFWTSPDTFCAMGGEARKDVRGIKLFADGAVGARTAMLEERYLSGEEGVLVWSDDELRDLIEGASSTGKSLSVHAIGNTAIDQTLRVLEQVRDCRRVFPEIRMEHCQFISPQAALKAKSMDLILCMQPNFSLDSTCYADRLPESYRLRNNPLRMLIDEAGFVPGRDLLFGSDGMPHGIRSALESALFPPLDGQRLTLDEFIAGYCMPDFSNGHIDLSIDYDGRKVDAEIVLEDR